MVIGTTASTIDVQIFKIPFQSEIVISQFSGIPPVQDFSFAQFSMTFTGSVGSDGMYSSGPLSPRLQDMLKIGWMGTVDHIISWTVIRPAVYLFNCRSKWLPRRKAAIGFNGRGNNHRNLTFLRCPSNTNFQWNIDPQGARTLGYLDVMDSSNDNSAIMDVVGTNSVNSGNNFNWVFAYQLPTVSTQVVSDITITTATGNGIVSNLGWHYPTQHGVCWSTSPLPTVADDHTEQRALATTGTFTVNMTNLSANTTYFVWAYATNDQGTAYGDAQPFTTESKQDQTITFAPLASGTFGDTDFNFTLTPFTL